MRATKEGTGDMARLINFGAGEVCDRLSILALKILYGRETSKDVTHFENERSVLLTKISSSQLSGRWFTCYTELAAVNAAIWQSEDTLRGYARNAANTNPESVAAIAYRLQQLNDRRAELIELINKEVGDHLGSEKLT